MKTILLAGLLAVAGLKTTAQERWTVQLNSDVLLSAKTEDTTANVVTLKDIKKGSLLVTYVPGKIENERKRRLIVMDMNRKTLYSKEAFEISIPASQLKEWRLNSPQIEVYTIPVLGEAGATIKLRPVHLATIKFDWPYQPAENQ